MEGMIALAVSTTMLGIGTLGTVFWIWMLVDAAKHEPRKGNDRLVWVIIIALTHLVGAAIYYFVRRPERIEQHGA